MPSLTAEDLKELGVTALGHRRKLLDAIAALRADRGAEATAKDAAAPSTAPSASPEDRAERRQVTVIDELGRFATRYGGGAAEELKSQGNPEPTKFRPYDDPPPRRYCGIVAIFVAKRLASSRVSRLAGADNARRIKS